MMQVALAIRMVLADTRTNYQDTQDGPRISGARILFTDKCLIDVYFNFWAIIAAISAIFASVRFILFTSWAI